MPRRLAATGPYQVKVVAYEDPPLKSPEVRIRTELASGKHGTVMAMFDGGVHHGRYFDQDMRLFVEGETTPRLVGPGRVGTSGLGSVVEIGSDVTRWAVGDRVFGLMDASETNVCHEARLYELGDIDPYLALCIEPSYVAFHSVREAQVRYGAQVAVIGLGALGLLAVRMARLSGAETLFALDPLAGRRDLALEYGADHVLDPLEGDPALEIRRLNGGKGVDVAIELAGVYSALGTAVRSVRVGGTVCSAGFYQNEAHGIHLGREWHHNRITVIVPHGCGWGSPPRDYPRWDEARAYACIASMMRKGRLTAPGLISPVVGLEEGPEVWRMVRDEPEKVMKYAIRF
jgi:threonine dehydrogenase-like Zn-dependent dehydrogenase